MFRNDKSDYDEISNILQYKFKNKNLLLQALTRRSALNEGRQSNKIDDFQRLEFIGDKVLNLVISNVLMQQHPSWREGQLTQEVEKYVNNSVPLPQVASSLSLGKFLIMGRGEEINNNARNNEKILADALEALIGALWIDTGNDYKFLSAFIVKHWSPLGLIRSADCDELEQIILDTEISSSRRVKKFRECCDNKHIDKTTLNTILSMTLGYCEILEMVLTKGVDKEYLDQALAQHLYGDEKEIELLLQHGANANFVKGEESLLQRAVDNCCDHGVRVVELLLKYGADPNWCYGKKTQTVIDEPNMSYTMIALSMLKKSDLKKKIIEYENLDTALHYLVRNDNVHDTYAQRNILQLLFRYNADPNRQDKEGKTPLHTFCEFSGCIDVNFDLLEDLIKAKASVSIQDKNGNTPLHALIKNFPAMALGQQSNFIKSIKLLVQCENDTNVQDMEGNTPLHIICDLMLDYKNTGWDWFHLSQFNFARDIIAILSSKGGNMQLENNAGITPQNLYDQLLISEHRNNNNCCTIEAEPTMHSELDSSESDQSNDMDFN